MMKKSYYPPLCFLLLAALLAAGCSNRVVRRRRVPDARRVPALGLDASAPMLGGSASAARMRGAASTYTLEPGDPVAIKIQSYPSGSSVDTVIDEAGYIKLPLVGEVRAAGRTPADLAKFIERVYVDEGIYKYVTVNVFASAGSYYLRGEIRNPGRVPLSTSGTTLLQALVQAGGWTDYANPKKVQILRGDEILTVNVLEIEKNPTKDVNLEAGDVIIIPRSMF